MGMGIYIIAWVFIFQFLIRLTTAHHADSGWAQGLQFGI